MLDLSKMVVEPEPEYTADPNAYSKRDVDAMNGKVDMFCHLTDPCDNCGAFNMRVGDYVCYGMCDPCDRARVFANYKE